MTELLIALALIAGEPCDYDPNKPDWLKPHAHVLQHNTPAVRAALRAWGEAAELLDEREEHFRSDDPATFVAQILGLRARRFQAVNWPSAREAWRLPEHKHCYAHFDLARQHETDLILRRGWHWNAAGWEEAILDTGRRRNVWGDLTAATTPDYYVFERRAAMHRVREQIGDRAWVIGDWPMPVPPWTVPCR